MYPCPYTKPAYQQSKANVTASYPQTEHFALSARIPRTPGQSGILIGEPGNVSSVGEKIPTPPDTTYDHTRDTKNNTTAITNDNNTPILTASTNQPGTTEITNVEQHLNSAINDHHHHHNERELDIITDISNAPSPASQSIFSCTSVSVGEQLVSPLTVVTEPEPIITNRHATIQHDHIIWHYVNLLNDNQLPTTPVIPAKSNPQSYQHTTFKFLELTDNINSLSTDEEIGGGRNKAGRVWESNDVGETNNVREKYPTTTSVATYSKSQVASRLNDSDIRHRSNPSFQRSHSSYSTYPLYSTITKYTNNTNLYPFTTRAILLTYSTIMTDAA